VQVLHAGDFVLVQIEATHAYHVVQALNFVDAIAFKPYRFDIGVSLQILDYFETYMRTEGSNLEFSMII